MDNLRSRIDIKLVNNEKDYLKCLSKPSYMSHKIFNNNIVAICKNELTLKFNKPAYIGVCISDLSKVLMCKFHYDYIKNKYDNKSKLLFTDIYSLMYESKTEDVYEDFSSDKKMFDFSDHSTKSNSIIISHCKNER